MDICKARCRRVRAHRRLRPNKRIVEEARENYDQYRARSAGREGRLERDALCGPRARISSMRHRRRVNGMVGMLVVSTVGTIGAVDVIRRSIAVVPF